MRSHFKAVGLITALACGVLILLTGGQKAPLQEHAEKAPVTSFKTLPLADARVPSAVETFIEALSDIEREKDDLKREKDILRYVNNLPDDQLMTVLQWLDHYGSTAIHHRMTLRLLRRWSGSDPASSAFWALGVDPARRPDALSAVATIWCENNPANALQWVTNIVNAEDRFTFSLALASELARTDPLGALHLAVVMPAGAKRDELIASITAEWAVRDPQQSLQWVTQHPDDSLRFKVVPGLANALIETDPSRALELLHALPAGEERETALLGLYQRWSQTDPETSAVSIEGISDFALRSRAMDEWIRHHSQSSPEEVISWINHASAEQSRDEWTSKLIPRLTTSSPAAAAMLSETLGDLGERERHLQDTLRSWLQHDYSAAQIYLVEANVHPELKERLLQQASAKGNALISN